MLKSNLQLDLCIVDLGKIMYSSYPPSLVPYLGYLYQVLISFYAFSAIRPNGTSREYRRTKFPYRYCHRRPNPADLPG